MSKLVCMASRKTKPARKTTRRLAPFGQGVFSKQPARFEPSPEEQDEAAAMCNTPRAITPSELMDQIREGMSEPESSPEPFVPSEQDWADYREWSDSLYSAPNRYAVGSLDRFASICADFDANRGR
jgi:hypothetical protein